MTYLIIQFLESALSFNFDQPVESLVRRIKQENDVVLNLDNFSDALTKQGAIRLISESDDLTIICDFSQENATTTGVSSLFNSTIKKQNVRLLTSDTPKTLTPFLIRLKAQRYESYEELARLLSNADE